MNIGVAIEDQRKLIDKQNEVLQYMDTSNHQKAMSEIFAMRCLLDTLAEMIVAADNSETEWVKP